ncbi:LOW QUALITY PROTEIN: keratin, type I cytoskeletal 19-like [Elgaria multicarinata webbii]|uniref:LOW QUALITY PROTEIN: keratin, type I cytoskeletal 19-like n=1 Tax=Elgaria multicarinata webbii TaxID=159646 RepID=UPI002FCD1F31
MTHWGKGCEVAPPTRLGLYKGTFQELHRSLTHFALPSTAGIMATTFSSRSLSFSGGTQRSRGGSLLGLGRSQTASSIYGGSGVLASFLPLVKDGLARRYGQGSAETHILDMNEKGTMQNLNDRLAAYLDRVRSLEDSNAQLEQNIRETYVKRASTGGPDLSSYFNTITDLKSKIQQETLNNAGLLLRIDNAKLAADDFRAKLESEVAIHLSVEGDLSGLRKALDELNASRASLQVQVDQLQEELTYLKRNHKEEVSSLQGRLGGTINVEVDAMPGVDLQKVLGEIRDQYEEVTEKNRREAEALHISQCDAINQEVAISTEALQAAQLKITELKRLAQTLEIELQSLRSTKGALEGTLAETESRYGMELSRLRSLVATREAELLQLRSDAQRQAEDYKRLMDIKNRLEQEIATYRRLLEGSDAEAPTTPEPSASRRVKTLIEELVDGKVVSSRVEEVEHQL